jgi:hypothetical protein
MVVGLIAVMLLLLESGGLAKPVTTTKARVDFDTQLKPIFQSKCMPCHFSGGKVYDRLPFDKPETIRKLATRLFTRIKDEHDRKLIEDFLAQP